VTRIEDEVEDAGPHGQDMLVLYVIYSTFDLDHPTFGLHTYKSIPNESADFLTFLTFDVIIL